MKLKPAPYILVALFLLVIVWWASVAEADTLFEIGPSQVSHNYSTGVIITMTERIKDKYDLTAGYISEQKFEKCDHIRCQWRIRPQLFACAERNFRSPWTDRLRLALGPCYFANEDRVAPAHFRFSLKAEYRITERFGLSMRHWSTAGSGKVGCYHTDYEDTSTPLICNDWNTGQDSWLRLTYYTR